MASFQLKTHIFPTLLFNPKFENVFFELHHPSFAHKEHRHKANYWCKKFSTETYPLTKVHPWRTDDRQTNTSCMTLTA